MQIILSDHNCEGYAQSLFDVLEYDGDWLELVPMKLQWFRDVGLSVRADDESVRRAGMPRVAFLPRKQLHLADG